MTCSRCGRPRAIRRRNGARVNRSTLRLVPPRSTRRRWWPIAREGEIPNRTQVPYVGFATRFLEFLQLLVEVLIKFEALNNGCVWLLELLAVETDKNGLDIVDKLIDPG